MQSNQPRVHTPQPPSLKDPHALGHCGTGTRKLGTTPILQSLRKLFRLANLKPVYPALPDPAHRNHNKCSCPQFPVPPAS